MARCENRCLFLGESLEEGGLSVVRNSFTFLVCRFCSLRNGYHQAWPRGLDALQGVDDLPRRQIAEHWGNYNQLILLFQLGNGREKPVLNLNLTPKAWQVKWDTETESSSKTEEGKGLQKR